MKYMFISDIHGDITKFDEMLCIFEKEKADKLVFLGDTASSYSEDDNIFIAQTLNKMAKQVIVIRGNCDTYSLEQNLNIQMYELDNLYVNGKTVTITHGHRYNSWELPPYCGDIFIQGHTHIPMLEMKKGIIVGNPGSPSRPRGVDLRCYIILDEKTIYLKTMEGNIIKKLEL